MENVLTMHSHRPLSAHTCTASTTLERSFHGWGAHTETKDWNLTRCAGLDCQSNSAASAGTSALVLKGQFAQQRQQWMLSVRRCAFRASKRPPRRRNVPTEALGRREMISGAAAAAIFPVFTAAPAAAAETPIRCHFPKPPPDAAYRQFAALASYLPSTGHAECHVKSISGCR